RDMAVYPEQAEQNRRKQRQAAQKLEEAMSHDPALRDDAKARQTSQKLAELAARLDQVDKQQAAQEEQAGKHEQINRVQADANKIADQQGRLNEQVRQFADRDKRALAEAHADPPAAEAQDQIVADLSRNQLNQAAEQ